MLVLHVSDFHSNQRWFDGLLHRASSHDLGAMSGALPDLAIAPPQPRQIAAR